MGAKRKGKMLAKEGSLELWVVPAEAGGWRAEVAKHKGGSLRPAIKSVWRKTRVEAGAVARGMKRQYF